MKERQKDQEDKTVQVKQGFLLSGDLGVEERHSPNQGIQTTLRCGSCNTMLKGTGAIAENPKSLAFTNWQKWPCISHLLGKHLPHQDKEYLETDKYNEPVKPISFCMEWLYDAWSVMPDIGMNAKLLHTDRSKSHLGTYAGPQVQWQGKLTSEKKAVTRLGSTELSALRTELQGIGS